MKAAVALAAVFLLAGCEPTPPEIATIQTAQGDVFLRDTPEYRGLKFARSRCSDCHAVETAGPSPRPSAPSFASVVKERNGNREALLTWLRQPHDYPDAMYFEIPAEHIDDLAAYMVTLQTQDGAP